MDSLILRGLAQPILREQQEMKRLLFSLFCVMAVGCSNDNPSASGGKNSSRPNTTAEPVDRANTGINVRDRDGTTKTPVDQKENLLDIATTSDIRKRVAEEKLSIAAHNVKIITQDGKVTLRGPVENTEEKQRIEEIARSIAGAKNVDSQLEVNGK